MKLPSGFVIPGRKLTEEERKTMFLSWKRTCMDRNKLEEFGIYISRRT
jgi:hypothetical protein